MSNTFQLAKKLMDMKKNMEDMQAKLLQMRVVGTSGGDMVRITLNGKFEVQDVFISPEAVDPDDIGTLQVLIASALNDATAKVNEQMQHLTTSAVGDFNAADYGLS